MTINKLTDNVKSSDEINKINEIIDGLSSVSVETDNLSITLNSSDELQTVGVIDQNDNTQAIKTWTGTSDEYAEIGTYFAYTRNDDTYYIRTLTPTTSTTVYSAIGTVNTRTIVSVDTDSIMLSDLYRYTRNESADIVDNTQYSATTLYNITDDNTSDELQTLLDEKVDKSSLVDITLFEAPVIIETYSLGTSWYRIYSDGWCEQGGRYTQTSTEVSSIIFLKEFKDTNYIFSRSGFWNNEQYGYIGYGTGESAKLTTGVTIYSTTTADYYDWQACGYLAEGQY